MIDSAESQFAMLHTNQMENISIYNSFDMIYIIYIKMHLIFLSIDVNVINQSSLFQFQFHEARVPSHCYLIVYIN